VAVHRWSIIISLFAALLAQPNVFAQTQKQSQKKKTGHASPSKKSAQKTAASAAKLHHIKRAFVASADLKPMAQQLLEHRTPEAYKGVEEYAQHHSKDAAAPLAWMVLGYAHYLDKDYAKARESWEHAEPLEPVLGDYIAYLRAAALQGEGNQEEVRKVLEGFDQKYPDSPVQRQVTLLYAGALVAANHGQQAIAYLEKHRAPTNPETELALAGAYQAEGAKDKAAEIFRRIYFEMPTSDQAGAAALALQGLGESSPQGSFEQRHTRADLLLKARRFQDAVTELTPLVEQAPAAKLLSMRMEYAAALYRARKRDDAQRLLQQIMEDDKAGVELKPQALYLLAEIARDKDDRSRHAELLSQLRMLAPESRWFEESLLSAGNMYMLKNEFDSGIKFYAELYQLQAKGRFSPYAHWKTAWLSYRLGKKEEAARLFEEQLQLYPSSSEVPAAIYWRGRLAEEEGNKQQARAYYTKLTENYRYFYYANLARIRLGRLGTEEIGDPALLDALPRPALPPTSWDPPEDNLRLQKARLLANGALFDFAIQELQLAAAGSPPWLAKALAELYGDSGSYIRGIEALKRAVPSYFAVEMDRIPRPVWEGLFPRAFWDDLKKNSAANHLDPYLVASLIRQESEFNPGAVSRANAMGLMQLLPTVGRGLAKEMKIHHFSNEDLLVAGTNLTLGTRYFKRMVDHYGGQVEYALAAYNAGEDRVDEWRKNGKFQDVEEFVESIPFTETREYVQAIMRNAALYKLLYPEQPATASSHAIR
jgi:peptidoglycan lytic transglycosylase